MTPAAPPSRAGERGPGRKTRSLWVLALASLRGKEQLVDSTQREAPSASLTAPHAPSAACCLVTYSAGQKPSSSRLAHRPGSPSPTWLPWGAAPAWKREGHVGFTGVYKETDP